MSPSELRVSKDRRTLTVVFEGQAPAELPAEALRVMSPSAEVQGHSPEQRVTVPGKRHVTIAAIEPVGHYAVKIVFDDGHSTGIYTWTYLRELAKDYDRLWAAYLSELEDKGMDRDHPAVPR
ncbi:MAG: DUF971 domain-containing protein [Pseudomonadota bacterium]